MARTTAIVLVTYNGWEMTKACLQDLAPLLGTAPEMRSAPGMDSAPALGTANSLGTAPRFVIAIADNLSTDGTVENLRKEFPAEKFPQIHVYPQTKNLGFGAANNAAIRGLISDGVSFDAVCLLNNDTRLDASAISNLRAELDRVSSWLQDCTGSGADCHKSVDFGLQDCAGSGADICKKANLGARDCAGSGADICKKANLGARDCAGSGEACAETSVEAVLAPTTLNVDGSRQNNFFAGLGPDGIGCINFLKNAFRNESGAARVLEGSPKACALEDIQETYWSSAVCWMMTAELWNRVGGFDENIFMYYEDADMALRCRTLGARFFITGRSAITHLGGGSAKSSLNRALQHDRSQQYVFKKHFGFKGFLLSKSFRILRSLVRVVVTLPQATYGANCAQKRQYIKLHLALLKEAIL